jgi:hypothetical protein
VTLGTECSEWSLARPSSSSYANKITPRVGDSVLGERFESIVFEVRIGAESAWHNVEVPMSNISSIVRTVGDPAPVPAPEPVKLQPTKAK